MLLAEVIGNVWSTKKIGPDIRIAAAVYSAVGKGPQTGRQCFGSSR
jgi:hypothetical protein